MKKWLVRIVLVLVVLLVAAIVTVAMFLNDIVKKGVETAGPRITKVDVKLESAQLSPFSGKATLKGFFLGNPPGYTTDSAIKVANVSVSLQPSSLFHDKVVIQSIHINAPQITLEGSLKENNLTKIQGNVSAASASSSSGGSSAQNGTSKKLQVTDIVISGAVLRVKSPLLGDKLLSVTLPEIHLTDLGTGPQGITPAELADKVMHALLKESGPAFANLAASLGETVGKEAEKKARDALKKGASGFKGLLGQ